jgi:hypothetical protein
MKLKETITIINKLFSKKNDISVSSIYSDLYNSAYIKSFILKQGLNSYEIIILVYSIYYLKQDPSLSINEVIQKSVDNVHLINDIEILNTMPSEDSCGECNGNGTLPCGTCSSEGEVECYYCDGTGKNGEEECDECGGTGNILCGDCEEGDLVCDECGGDGRIETGEIDVSFYKEYWVTSFKETIDFFKSIEEGSYVEDFAEYLDTHKRTTLFLGYVRDELTENDLISQYNIDSTDIENSDVYFLEISELYNNGPLMRMVGHNKFGKMI